MASYFNINLSFNTRFVHVVTISFTISFFIAMDTHLYFVLQRTSNLAHQGLRTSAFFSPFHPLTMKLLMTDPINHYILGPLAELFDDITSFSKIFYFITPNMISWTHAVLSIVSAKLISSEYLRTRRYGVALFFVRSWLDDLDGVVYRSRSNTRGKYQSHHESFGYWVDMICDTTGGTMLTIGIYLYLRKYFASLKETNEFLPSIELLDREELNDVIISSAKNKSSSKFTDANISSELKRSSDKSSPQRLLLQVILIGIWVGVASATWDRIVARYIDVFQADLNILPLTNIQTEALHSGTTWLIIYLWRIWEGQAILHMLLIAIFVDKIWEFVCMFYYRGFFITAALCLVSWIHLNKLRYDLKIQ